MFGNRRKSLYSCLLTKQCFLVCPPSENVAGNWKTMFPGLYLHWNISSSGSTTSTQFLLHPHNSTIVHSIQYYPSVTLQSLTVPSSEAEARIFSVGLHEILFTSCSWAFSLFATKLNTGWLSSVPFGSYKHNGIKVGYGIKVRKLDPVCLVS